MVLATSGIAYSAVDHYTAAIEPVDAFGPLASRPAQDRATNILLVGSDERGDISPERRLELSLGLEDFGRHTDTMMLVHITSRGKVDVVTLPRDSEVTIPAHASPDGEQVRPAQGKLNSAYALGGAPLLVSAVEGATDVRVDHYVEVSFEGFVDIVNALGGVEVCTNEAIYDELSGLDLPAGRTVVDGDMGLSYVRARYFDPMADYGRMQRQQAFLAAMARRAASLDVLLNPFRVNATVDAVLGSLRADESFDGATVRGLLRKMRSTTPDDVTFHTVPVAGEDYLDDGGLAVQWDQDAAQELFAALRKNAPVLDIVATEEVLPAPAAVPVSVLNGNGTAGIATQTAEQLTGVGFPIMTVGDAQTRERTLIEYPRGEEKNAQSIARFFPNAEITEADQDRANVTVTLGEKFSGLAKVDLPAAAPGLTGLGEMTGTGGVCN